MLGKAERWEFDFTYPMLPLWWVLGPREALRHFSRDGKAQSEMWESQGWFGGPQACDEFRAVGFSDSWTSRCSWESRKSREWSV